MNNTIILSKFKNYLIILELILFILSLVFIFFNKLIICIILFGIAIFLYLNIKRIKYKNKTDENDYEFLSNLIYKYKLNPNKLNLISNTLNKKFYFYKEFLYSLKLYKKSINAEKSFLNLFKSTNSFYFTQIINLIIQSLDENINIYFSLIEVQKQFNNERKFKSEISGNLNSSLSMIQLGSVIFFPIFAGISMNILEFASKMNNIHLNFENFSVLFVFYIIIINIINFKYKKEILLIKINNILFFSSFSLILFKISSIMVSHSILI